MVVTTFNQKKALVGRGRLGKNFMLIKNYQGHYFYFLPVSVIITNLLWTFVSSSTGRTGPGRPELWWPNIGMAAQLGCSHSLWLQPINWTYSIISFHSFLSSFFTFTERVPFLSIFTPKCILIFNRRGTYITYWLVCDILWVASLAFPIIMLIG